MRNHGLQATYMPPCPNLVTKSSTAWDSLCAARPAVHVRREDQGSQNDAAFRIPIQERGFDISDHDDDDAAINGRWMQDSRRAADLPRPRLRIPAIIRCSVTVSTKDIITQQGDKGVLSVLEPAPHGAFQWVGGGGVSLIVVMLSVKLHATLRYAAGSTR